MGLKNARSLSKFLALILRHEAAQFGLETDNHGWANVAKVVEVMRHKMPQFSREDLQEIVDTDNKRRYQIDSDRIRARYGHSIPVAPVAEACTPPEVLYHGTADRDVPFILREGLKPMSRRFVHLSPRLEDAVQVGHRHSRNPVVLKVRAAEAHAAGTEFFCEENVYLAGAVPPEFIEVTEG